MHSFDAANADELHRDIIAPSAYWPGRSSQRRRLESICPEVVPDPAPTLCCAAHRTEQRRIAGNTLLADIDIDEQIVFPPNG
jgi:hypothetical protein